MLVEKLSILGFFFDLRSNIKSLYLVHVKSFKVLKVLKHSFRMFGLILLKKIFFTF